MILIIGELLERFVIVRVCVGGGFVFLLLEVKVKGKLVFC